MSSDNIFQISTSAISLITVVILIVQLRKSNIQQFESTFFQMISLHYEIISGFKSGSKLFEEAVNCIDVLGAKYYTYQNEDGDFTQGELNGVTSLDDARDVMENSYKKHYYSGFESSFNHYFRNLYLILKFTDESPLINKSKKKFYARILRAQMSQNELHVAYYNSMSKEYGFPKGMYLMNKYDMWQNMRMEKINSFFILLFDEMRNGAASAVKTQVFSEKSLLRKKTV